MLHKKDCENSMALLTRYKHVDSKLDMAIDFTNRLASGETLSSGQAMTVKNTDKGTIGDLTIDAVTISGTTIVSNISAGTALKKVGEDRWETRYCIRGQVVTSSGETETEVVELVVYDCLGTGS